MKKLTVDKSELERKVEELTRHLTAEKHSRDPCESVQVMDDVFRYLERSFTQLDDFRRSLERLKGNLTARDHPDLSVIGDLSAID